MNKILSIAIISLISSGIFSQEDPKWDDTRSNDWPDECRLVQIPSSIDGKDQAAYLYKSQSENPRPLIISLHTWSGGYDQKDTLSWQCIERDYHYIHPDFRGRNNTYEACGSHLAIGDIDDAIDYMLKNANVDPDNIHITGTSGGGHATLLAYMKTRHKVKTFSAWVPISNLVDWYHESEGRGNKYSRDIALSTTGKDFGKDDYFIDGKQARERSPFYMPMPVEERKNSKLFIYAGVHDGYTGSVPITQSLNFYNKVVGDFDDPDENALIPSGDIITLLTYRGYPASDKDLLGGREIHYRRSYKDRVQITIFEGRHERVNEVALKQIDVNSILTIGDSNGANEGGWVYQLKQLHFEDNIYNTCISGNTIGFNNLGTAKRNTLLNVNRFMDEGYEAMGSLDAIVIMLGTNDCKAIFTDSLKMVPGNMKTLIKKIKAHPVYAKHSPEIFIVSPPPIGPDKMLIPKYHGGAKRVESLVPEFKKTAKREGCTFIDCHSVLNGKMYKLSRDGIHLSPMGQKIIARLIDEKISVVEKPAD